MQHLEPSDRSSSLGLRHAALITGITYLLNPVTFAELYVMPRLVAPTAVQTAANLTAHPHLFAAALLSYLVSALGDIVLAWSLFHLLAPVNRSLALLGSLLQWIYAAVWLSVISDLGVLYRFVAVPDYTRQINPADLPSHVLTILASFRSGWGLALIFFGLHLVVTGFLIARSTYLPRWLGWLLFLNGWAWVIDSLRLYLFPKADLDLLHILFAGEMVFMVWLLGWGWRLKEPPRTDS